MNMMSKRVPPSNLQAEQQVLGALLSPEREVYSDLKPILRAEHFADPVHAVIYGQIIERVESGYPEWDMLTDANRGDITPDLARHLDEVGGAAYLQSLWDADRANPVPVVPLAEQIATAYLHRVILNICDEMGAAARQITNRVFDRDKELQDLNLSSAVHLRLSAARHLLDLAELGLNFDDVQVVDGHVVDMRYPPDIAGQSDQYGEPMLLTTALDREEALILSEFHSEGHRRGERLCRVAERDHHWRRHRLFDDALLDVDPMDPPKPCEDSAPWEQGL
jgi:DnaB-like helicase N terminal domain